MTLRLAVLVTGSRNWTHKRVIDEALDSATWGNPPGTILIHGDCGETDECGRVTRGADWIAAEIGRACDWYEIAMPAQWDRDGKSAGPKRNAAMVRVLSALRDCGYECVVLAFPLGESRGTRNCVELARKAGFEVRVIEP